MRRFVPIGVLLLLAGCQNLEGPRARRADPVRVDNPHLTIDEQERLGRERLALPQESPTVGPPTYQKSPFDRSYLEKGH